MALRWSGAKVKVLVGAPTKPPLHALLANGRPGPRRARRMMLEPAAECASSALPLSTARLAASSTPCCLLPSMHATLPSPGCHCVPSTLAALPALPWSIAAVPDAAASAATHGERGGGLLQECLNACPLHACWLCAESLPPADESRYRAAWKFGTLGQEHYCSGDAFVLLWKVSRGPSSITRQTCTA